MQREGAHSWRPSHFRLAFTQFIIVKANGRSATTASLSQPTHNDTKILDGMQHVRLDYLSAAAWWGCCPCMSLHSKCPILLSRRRRPEEKLLQRSWITFWRQKQIPTLKKTWRTRTLPTKFLWLGGGGNVTYINSFCSTYLFRKMAGFFGVFHNFIE